MSPELETLLDELVRRHARGEPLDVEGTLRRAGDEADELAPLIEAFLARAPRRGPTPASLRFVQSLDDPPMLRARVAKALKVDDVVDAIVAECELAPEARPRVRRYYQQLEGGILDPTRVAASVWDAITGLLGRSRALLSAPAGPAPAAAPMYRADASFDSAGATRDALRGRAAVPARRGRRALPRRARRDEPRPVGSALVAETRRIECDGVGLHVELDGPDDAATVLFLHGVGSSGRTWEWLPDELTRGRRIVRVDLRGHGRSDHAPGTYLDRALRRRRRGRPALGRVAPGSGRRELARRRHRLVARPEPSRDLVTAALLEDPPLLAGETPETEAGRFRDVFHAVKAVILEGRERGLSEEELAGHIADDPLGPAGDTGARRAPDGGRARRPWPSGTAGSTSA